jgi:serine/threonine protein kinase KIN1/2
MLNIGSVSEDSLTGDPDALDLEDGLSRSITVASISVKSSSSSRRSTVNTATREVRDERAPDMEKARVNVEAQDTHTGAGLSEQTQEKPLQEVPAKTVDRDKTGPAFNARRVSIKGLFGLSTTSTKPVSEIRLDIMRVLKRFDVQMSEIRGGFHCHVTINEKMVWTGLVKPPFYGILDEIAPEIPPKKRDTEKNVASFALFIVKMPLMSQHGIQFERLQDTKWAWKSRKKNFCKRCAYLYLISSNTNSNLSFR